MDDSTAFVITTTSGATFVVTNTTVIKTVALITTGVAPASALFCLLPFAFCLIHSAPCLQ